MFVLIKPEYAIKPATWRNGLTYVSDPYDLWDQPP